MRTNQLTTTSKLRAWDNNGYMMEVLSVDWDRRTLYGRPIRYPGHDGASAISIRWTDWLENFILLLPTGLLDSRGQEIYQGDLVQDQIGNTWEVYYDMGQFLLRDKYFLDDDRPITLWSEPTTLIVGNIYENPELTSRASPSCAYTDWNAPDPVPAPATRTRWCPPLPRWFCFK